MVDVWYCIFKVNYINFDVIYDDLIVLICDDILIDWVLIGCGYYYKVGCIVVRVDIYGICIVYFRKYIVVYSRAMGDC